jgi:hypothetical protein
VEHHPVGPLGQRKTKVRQHDLNRASHLVIATLQFIRNLSQTRLSKALDQYLAGIAIRKYLHELLDLGTLAAHWEDVVNVGFGEVLCHEFGKTGV